METFGQLVRRLRNERGLTLAQVADQLGSYLAEGDGVSVAMLSRIETDDRIPSVRIADAMAEFYGIEQDLALELLAESQVSRRFSAADASRDPGKGKVRQRSDVRDQPASRASLREVAQSIRVDIAATPNANQTPSPGADLEGLLTIADLAVKQIERAASESGVPNVTRAALHSRAQDIAWRLERVFGRRR